MSTEGLEGPDVALSLSDLALVIQRQGRLDEASDLFEEALDLESYNFV